MPELTHRGDLSLFEDIPFYADAARLKAKVSPTAAISDAHQHAGGRRICLREQLSRKTEISSSSETAISELVQTNKWLHKLVVCSL